MMVTTKAGESRFHRVRHKLTVLVYIMGTEHILQYKLNMYRLDGPDMEFQWRRDFPHLSRPALGCIQLLVQWVLGHFPGVKQPQHGNDHPPLSGTKVNEWVQL